MRRRSGREFLNAALFFKDKVYTRICDLEDVQRIFGADLQCHKDCIKLYLLRYERAIQDGQNSERLSSRSERERVFKSIMVRIEQQLKNGIGYPLSDLRDVCNSMLDLDKFGSFDNKELKVLQHNYLGENIYFSTPTNRGKSCLLFHSNIGKGEVVEQVRNSNPVRETAFSTRERLMKEPGPLEDRFCDANDLSDAWYNMKIPEPILEFLCVLFHVEHKHFYNYDDEANPKITSEKRRKIMVFFQILFYDVNNGEKKMPLQMLVAEMICDACRSKTVVTACNHWGLSISYSELLRYRTDMASYVLSNQIDDTDVPLPSHFQTDIHTSAAFDNFDHNEHTPSGLGSTHDTVSILIQDKPEIVKRKPKMSETDVTHGCRNFIGPMSCQKIGEPLKLSKTIEIPTNYDASPVLFKLTEAKYDDITKTDTAWMLSRLDLSMIESDTVSPFPQEQVIPEWAAFNSFVSIDNKK